MPKIMTKKYCEKCPFFAKELGYLPANHSHWKDNGTRCQCRDCMHREYCENNGPREKFRECFFWLFFSSNPKALEIAKELDIGQDFIDMAKKMLDEYERRKCLKQRKA